MRNSMALFILGLSTAAVGTFPALSQDAPIKVDASLTADQVKELNELVVQAGTLVSRKQYQEARDVFEKALKICPKSNKEGYANLLSNLGAASLALGDSKALTQLQESYELDPNNANTLYNLANYYAVEGNVKEANVWLRKCIREHPTDPRLTARAKSMLATLNETSVGSGDPESADYLDNLIKTDGAGRWPHNKTPVKVFFERGDGIPGYSPEFQTMLVNAFNQWTAATKGKLSWIEASSKNNADIVCEWKGEPDNSAVESGNALTSGNPDASGAFVMDHVIVTVCTLQKNRIGKGYVPAGEADVNTACLHEVGHALGLRGHSSNKGDVMYFAGFNQKELSERDKKTIARLYQPN